MAIAAFRYCAGRMTYISGACAEWVEQKWQEFPPNVQSLIRKELEELFRRDDEDRAMNEPFKALGWDCDRAAWEKVRALWAAEQQPARPVELAPSELAYRMKWLAAEMETVGSAMVRAGQEMEGFDLQDAAGALRASIKDKT